MDLADLPPRRLGELLAAEGIERFYLVWDEDAGGVRASHAILDPLARRLEADARDFDRHEGVFGELAPRSGALLGAFVHRTCRGQGAGGVRFWRYETLGGWLEDGLRLSRGMTHKNALAGLWWGGGKGVIARGTGREDDADPAVRRRIYEDYGAFMSSLRGCYVTAEDAGTCVADMAAVFSRTRFTTCIPEALGGSGNPSVPTARGVLRGMEAALRHAGRGGIAGKTIAIQGVGNVGGPLVGFLAEAGVGRVIAADVVPGRDAVLRERHPDLDLEVRIVEPGDVSIIEEPADVLAPCAVGGLLGPETIPRVAAPIVCGAANNQLLDLERDDRLLAERGIVYLPDFLVNRMGIVACADEQAGHVTGDPDIERHLGDAWDGGIYRLALSVLERAAATERTPQAVALELAEERSRQTHPIHGHRGARIIRSLIDDGWASGRSRPRC